MPVTASLELSAGLSTDLMVYPLALLLRRAQGAAPVDGLGHLPGLTDRFLV